jgi:hypothetical protein
MFTRELVEKLHPIPGKLIYGWGIDFLSAITCKEQNWKIGVCDKTPTIHLISQTLRLNNELSQVNNLAEINMFEYFQENNLFNTFMDIRNNAMTYEI